MTKEELIKRLKTLQAMSDCEVAHMRADDLLLEFIDDEEVDEAFYDISRWYA